MRLLLRWWISGGTSRKDIESTGHWLFDSVWYHASQTVWSPCFLFIWQNLPTLKDNTKSCAGGAPCRNAGISKFTFWVQSVQSDGGYSLALCTYHRWFGRPQNAACPSYWESPMGNAKLHRILRFRMGSHHLPVEEGRHFNLPRASRVCNLCNTDALGDERHMLLECPALADLRLQFSSLLLPCSGVMRRLLWAKDQHEVCRYIIACLDRMSSQ